MSVRCLFLLACLMIGSFAKFQTIPELQFKVNKTGPVAISLIESRDRIILGFNSGYTTPQYNMQGRSISAVSPLNHAPRMIAPWSYGYTMIDDQWVYSNINNEVKSVTNIKPTQWGIINGALAFFNHTPYTTINMGTLISEYDSTILKANQTRNTYQITANQTQEIIQMIEYSADYMHLYASTSQENVYVFDTVNASVISFYPINDTLVKIQALEGGQNVMLALGRSGNLYRINRTQIIDIVQAQSQENQQRYNLLSNRVEGPKNPTTLKKCRNTHYAVLIDSSDNSLHVLDTEKMSFQQNFKPSVIPRAIDCNSQHLILVSPQTQIQMFHYQVFPTWVYFVVSGVVLVLIILGVVCYIKRKRAKGDEYGKIAKDAKKDYKKVDKAEKTADKYMPDDVKKQKDEKKKQCKDFFKTAAKKVTG